MVKQADNPGKPRTVQVMLRLTPEGVATLDRLRGDESRQTYLRGLVTDDYLRRKDRLKAKS